MSDVDIRANLNANQILYDWSHGNPTVNYYQDLFTGEMLSWPNVPFQLAKDAGVKLDKVLAEQEASKTRESATLVALKALADAIAAGGGSIEVATILEAIEAEGEASRTQAADQHQAEMAELNRIHAEQLAAKNAEIAGLQAELSNLNTTKKPS